jgi:hypothetical protein
MHFNMCAKIEIRARFFDNTCTARQEKGTRHPKMPKIGLVDPRFPLHCDTFLWDLMVHKRFCSLKLRD